MLSMLSISIYLSIDRSIDLSIYRSIDLSIYIFIYIYKHHFSKNCLTNKKHCERDIEKTLPEQNRPAISLLKTYVSRHHPGRKTVWEKLCSMALLSFFSKLLWKKCIHSKARFSPHMQLPETYMVSFFHLSPLQRSLQYVFSGPR